MSTKFLPGEPANDARALTAGQARFVVFGVGGMGGNAVEHMLEKGVKGVTFVCTNTDLQDLNESSVPNKIQIGAEITEGLGAGGDPEIGCAAAEESIDNIKAAMENHHMVFITAGMGGGTGTGAAPVIARAAKDLGKLTVAVVTTPFSYEASRVQIAEQGIKRLSEYVDAIIVIPNDKLEEVYPNFTLDEAFEKGNEILMQGVSGLTETIHSPGMINIDFRDVRTVMSAKGHAIMGVAHASGNDRARQAAEKALHSPLLDDIRLENAQGALINIHCANFRTKEMREIAEVIQPILSKDGNARIFFGVVKNTDMGEDEIRITIIATGLVADERPKTPSSDNSPNVAANSATTQHVSAISALGAQQTNTANTGQATTSPTVSVSNYLKNQSR